MRLVVGSTNSVKVDAVREIIQEYDHLRDADVIGISVDSGVSDQPKTLEETVEGALSRARHAFDNCTYSFGIESGLMVVPHTKTGHMDVCVCAIFDGSEYHLGLSSAWEAPSRVMHYIVEEGMDMNEAAYRAGLTDNMSVGSAEGLVGIVTRGRLTRKVYTKEAVRTALIHLEP